MVNYGGETWSFLYFSNPSGFATVIDKTYTHQIDDPQRNPIKINNFAQQIHSFVSDANIIQSNRNISQGKLLKKCCFHLYPKTAISFSIIATLIGARVGLLRRLDQKYSIRLAN